MWMDEKDEHDSCQGPEARPPESRLAAGVCPDPMQAAGRPGGQACTCAVRTARLLFFSGLTAIRIGELKCVEEPAGCVRTSRGWTLILYNSPSALPP